MAKKKAAANKTEKPKKENGKKSAPAAEKAVKNADVKAEKGKKGSVALLLSMLAALLIGLSVRTFGFSFVLVRTEAMNDTLFAGDIVLISRSAEPEAGNIVLAGAVNGSAFRRVAGEPGDRVSVNGGQTVRNSMPLYEPYAKGAPQWEIPETQLGEDVYLLLPDDRSFEGALVSRGGIAGVARAVIWPLSRAGFL